MFQHQLQAQIQQQLIQVQLIFQLQQVALAQVFQTSEHQQAQPLYQPIL